MGYILRLQTTNNIFEIEVANRFVTGPRTVLVVNKTEHSTFTSMVKQVVDTYHYRLSVTANTNNKMCFETNLLHGTVVRLTMTTINAFNKEFKFKEALMYVLVIMSYISDNCKDITEEELQIANLFADEIKQDESIFKVTY